MDKFIDFLYVIAECNIPIEQKLIIIKKIVEDITSYDIGNDERIAKHLEVTIKLLKEIN
jgi:hypothetical protein